MTFQEAVAALGHAPGAGAHIVREAWEVPNQCLGHPVSPSMGRDDWYFQALTLEDIQAQDWILRFQGVHGEGVVI